MDRLNFFFIYDDQKIGRKKLFINYIRNTGGIEIIFKIFFLEKSQVYIKNNIFFRQLSFGEKNWIFSSLNKVEKSDT